MNLYSLPYQKSAEQRNKPWNNGLFPFVIKALACSAPWNIAEQIAEQRNKLLHKRFKIIEYAAARAHKRFRIRKYVADPAQADPVCVA